MDRVHPDDVALLGDMSLPKVSSDEEFRLLNPVMAALVSIIRGPHKGVTA